MIDTSAERDFAARESDYYNWTEKRPVCDGCGEHVTDDVYFEIDDLILCESCFHEYCDANYKHFFDD